MTSHDPASTPTADAANDTLPLRGFAAVSEPLNGDKQDRAVGGDERSANSHLSEAGVLSEWIARAEWLEREAALDPDLKRKARALTVASELWAMAGNPTQSQAVAAQATKLGSWVGQRQARQLLFASGDAKGTVSLLTAEALTAPTAHTRAHAATFAAELSRLKLADTSAALKHWEQASRILPSDPRPHLFKLSKQLGTSGKVPSLQWPAEPQFDVLRQLAQEVARLRSDAPSASGSATPATRPGEPVATDPSGAECTQAFVDVLRALARGEREAAADALQRFGRAAEFSRPARWLAAALLAPTATTRPRARSLLQELLTERGSASLRRLLAARMLELADTAGTQQALQQETRSEDEAELAFSPLDHLALGALCRASAEVLSPWLTRAAQTEELKPLVWAVISALELPRERPAFSDSRATAALSFAQALAKASDPSALQAAARQYGAAFGSKPLVALLNAEHAWSQGDLTHLEPALLAMTASSDEQTNQAHYALGLWHEAAGAIEQADRHYALALRSEVFSEAAARALFARLPKDRTRKLLTTLADASADPERKCSLLLEALLLERPGHQDLEMCERAHAADERSVLVPFLALRTARTRKDPLEELRWRALMLAHKLDDWERTLVLLQQGLLEPTADGRRTRLAEAFRTWPRDWALAGMYEREQSAPPMERAKLREQLAALQKDTSFQSQLLLEAAWLYESAGSAADAARGAALAAPVQPLAEPCLMRNAPGQAQGESVREHLQRQLAGPVESPQRAAELYLALAELEAAERRPEKHIECLAQAVAQVPDHLPSLAALEAAALWQVNAKASLTATSQLAAVLPAQDAPALVLLAARLEKLENGWAAAYPVLKQTPRLPRLPLYLERQLLAQARFMGHDAMAYEMTRRLCDVAGSKLDVAILNLRAAELAARLDDTDSALSHLGRSLEAEPRYLPALALSAQLLQQRGKLADAAAVHERLSNVCRVTAHRVTHGLAAATLWLDQLGDRERGLTCLERAAALDPADAQVFERLSNLYQERGEHTKLEAALNRRLEVVSNRENIASLQLLKSQVLVAAGNTKKARESLLLVIKASPENVEALTSLATLSEQDGDPLSAEHALLQLVRLNNDPQVQADVYQRLAQLYRGPLSNPKRALRCYQEVLRRRPHDAEAFDAMLRAHVDAGLAERAVELLEQQCANEPERERKLELQLKMAELQASSKALQASAEQTYAELLNLWPRDERVLHAAATFYVNTERAAYVSEWSRRLNQQARNACLAGEYANAPLAALRTVASVLGDSALSVLAGSALGLVSGSTAHFPPALGKAMARPLDGLLAPASVTSALRTLLMQTRGILDQALELNLAPLAPRRIMSERVRTAFETKARAMGIVMPSELFTTNVEPTVALVTGSPSRVILGSHWVTDAPPGVLDFVVWRLLKADQARVGLFIHLEPGRLQTVLLAFLSCFVEVKTPALDQALFETTRQRVASRLSKTLDDDLPVLALDVLTQLREGAPDLSDAVRRWVNRSALLATGDPQSALAALSVLSRGVNAEAAGPGLDTQTAKHPEARDLVASLLDDNFVEAYRRCRS
jgi:hypothetical protein